MNHLRTPTRLLSLTRSELCLSSTLRSGQSFRWRAATGSTFLLPETPMTEWSTTFSDRVVVLAQDDRGLHYASIYPTDPPGVASHGTDVKDDTTSDLLTRYFALDVDLCELCQSWRRADPNFSRRSVAFSGVRVLRQEPWEALLSYTFICSSNNNISRITSMISRLCSKYGRPLPSTSPTEPMYTFPTPSSISSPSVEADLRQLGFGYRAPYVQKTATAVSELGGTRVLESWKGLELHEVREKLIQFPGVGPKVADCIALFGLGFDSVVPIDTHVWQIACRDYGFGLKGKGPVSKLVYVKVQRFLEGIWGPFAGWAQQILFTADLKSLVEVGVEVKVERATELETPVKSQKTWEAYPSPASSVDVKFKVKRTRTVSTEAYPPSPSSSEVYDTLMDRVKRRRTLATLAL